MRPVALDLCTGIGGWAEGLVEIGYYVIGVDIEDMFAALNEPRPEHFDLVIENICAIKGADYAHVSLIVGSSPCQDFSYRAMPWSRAKAMHAPFLGIYLFWQQFRIQREACEAAGRHIPMVVENVRGAIPWVGRSRWNFGSYHLWGDVPALMPPVSVIKNGHVGGGSWFAIGSSGQTTVGGNPDGRKVPGFRFDGSGRSFQTASVAEHHKGSVGYERNHPNALGWKIPATSSHSPPVKPPAPESPKSHAPSRNGLAARTGRRGLGCDADLQLSSRA